MNRKSTNKGKIAKLTPYFVKWVIRKTILSYTNSKWGKDVEVQKQNLFWYDKTPNFGDWIGPYIFEKLNGEKPVYSEPDNSSKASTTLAVGSIVNLSKRNAIIWGSGIMDSKTFFVKPHKTLAVRGPLTRKRFLELNYPCPEVYGDPGLLMPRFFNPTVEKIHPVGIIPHHIDYKRVSELYKNNTDIKVINVFGSVEEVISHILSCKEIVSSSLHGVILGNAYKIPTSWVHFSLNLPGDDVKFFDYFLSIGMDKVQGPIDLKSTPELTTEELQQLSKKFQQPPSYPLIDEEALLKACPF